VSKGVPREGPSLLAGLVVCGRCGHRLTVHYNRRLRYLCEYALSEYGEATCLRVTGDRLDAFVAKQVLAVLQPASLELSLAAEADLCNQCRQEEQQWKQRLERATYEADRAARQYAAVEPENRLVARTLECRWEETLLQQRQVEEEYRRFQQKQTGELSVTQREEILRLSKDVSQIWHASTTTVQDRQEIIRLLLDHVVVNVMGESEQMDVQLHWAGGAVSSHRLLRTVCRYDQLSNYDELCERIKSLRMRGEPLAKIAEYLNRNGFSPPKKTTRFNADMVGRLLGTLGVHIEQPWAVLGSDLLEEHERWLPDLARELGVTTNAVRCWRRAGWVSARKVDVARGRWAIWVDADELSRLRRLRTCPREGESHHFPVELTIPNVRRRNA
jgi:hypothetical protein